MLMKSSITLSLTFLFSIQVIKAQTLERTWRSPRLAYYEQITFGKDTLTRSFCSYRDSVLHSNEFVIRDVIRSKGIVYYIIQNKEIFTFFAVKSINNSVTSIASSPEMLGIEFNINPVDIKRGIKAVKGLIKTNGTDSQLPFTEFHSEIIDYSTLRNFSEASTEEIKKTLDSIIEIKNNVVNKMSSECVNSTSQLYCDYFPAKALIQNGFSPDLRFSTVFNCIKKISDQDSLIMQKYENHRPFLFSK